MNLLPPAEPILPHVALRKNDIIFKPKINDKISHYD